MHSHLDETMLASIARATGGAYQPLGADGRGLDQLYAIARSSPAAADDRRDAAQGLRRALPDPARASRSRAWWLGFAIGDRRAAWRSPDRRAGRDGRPRVVLAAPAVAVAGQRARSRRAWTRTASATSRPRRSSSRARCTRPTSRASTTRTTTSATRAIAPAKRRSRRIAARRSRRGSGRSARTTLRSRSRRSTDTRGSTVTFVAIKIAAARPTAEAGRTEAAERRTAEARDNRPVTRTRTRRVRAVSSRTTISRLATRARTSTARAGGPRNAGCQPAGRQQGPEPERIGRTAEGSAQGRRTRISNGSGDQQAQDQRAHQARSRRPTLPITAGAYGWRDRIDRVSASRGVAGSRGQRRMPSAVTQVSSRAARPCSS